MFDRISTALVTLTAVVTILGGVLLGSATDNTDTLYGHCVDFETATEYEQLSVGCDRTYVNDPLLADYGSPCGLLAWYVAEDTVEDYGVEGVVSLLAQEGCGQFEDGSYFARETR